MQIVVTVCSFLLFTFSVHAHVLEDFKDCREFFYGEQFPEWPPNRHHVEICQNYKNNYYFATLYDTRYRIPVYSAYVFEQSNDHPEAAWCVEPQLVNKNWNKQMTRADDLVKKRKVKNPEDTGIKQAVYDDYTEAVKKGYDRGHLNPKGHHGGDASRATYTLTNVVPQSHKMNNEAWSKYEGDLQKTFKQCDKAYVLVGAIPSTNPETWIKRENKKRVNVPDYMWHAYCCVGKDGRPITSGAAAAKNTDENKMQMCSLENLQEFFNKLSKKPVLFKNCNAPPNENIKGTCTSVID